MSDRTFQYKTALITGASSGLGAAFCRALDGLGIDRIVLVARRRDALVSVASMLNCDTTIVVADLSTEGGIQLVIEHLTDIDLLINNAGFGSFGMFSQLSQEREANMVRVNCLAPVQLTAAIIPRFVEQDHGCIVNISSGMAFTPMPFMSTYAASKAFLLSWTEGIAGELNQTNVRCISICPGTFQSEFADASGIPVEDIPGSALVTCSLESVVNATMSAIQSNTTIAIPGIGNRLASIGNAFVPRSILRWILASLMRGSATQISG